MGFEDAIKQGNQNEKEKEQPGFLEEYQDSNKGPALELSEKKKREHEEFEKRQSTRLEKLKKDEEDGKLVTRV